MKAVIISKAGGSEGLIIREVEQPRPAPDQVLVRVKASALNRADLLQRQGHYPAPFGSPQNIPGLEFAGEVVEAGPLVQSWKPGQRVFGITGGGAHAEYIAVHERTVAEVPHNLSWTEAAAIPEVFITAQDALWKQAALRPSEIVLIHAVGSGVGLASAQLARVLGAQVYGTSRTQDKIERALEFGLTQGITASSAEDLPEKLHHLTQGRGADVVLDLLGGPYVNASLKLLALRGRMIFIGTMAGSRTEFDLRHVLSKRLMLRGTVLRARPLEEKIAATQAFARELCPLFERGALRPVIDKVFDMSDIQEAHQRMESNQSFGKVVVRIDSAEPGA